MTSHRASELVCHGWEGKSYLEVTGQSVGTAEMRPGRVCMCSRLQGCRGGASHDCRNPQLPPQAPTVQMWTVGLMFFLLVSCPCYPCPSPFGMEVFTLCHCVCVIFSLTLLAFIAKS